MIALFLIGVIGITVGFMNLLNKDAGWQRVQVTPQERNYSENFILQYHFSGSGAENKSLNQKLESVYGDACVNAYRLFTPDEEFSGIQNVYYINRNPNAVITVDPVLYAAFEKLAGTPYLYLGPVYEYYYGIIYNADEASVNELDPRESAEAAAYVAKLAEYAANRDAVNLELLGNNQVTLHVSQDYLEFAAAEDIDCYIDFAYMTNAFVIDYLADTLIAQNLTEGYLVSADGYTRCLDGQNLFSFNIFDREGSTVHHAAVMTYQGPISMVYLKDYPSAGSDVNYRANADRFVHLFADPADGMYQTSVENLVSYSYEHGCADVLLKMLPSFVTDTFSVPEDVFSVWCEGEQICYNDAAVSFSNLMQNQERTYHTVLKK